MATVDYGWADGVCRVGVGLSPVDYLAVSKDPGRNKNRTEVGAYELVGRIFAVPGI